MVDISEITRKEYPSAKTGYNITESYLELLEKEYNSPLDNMLFATSVCSDDINVSTDFRKFQKRPFTLGGLGGLPFAGYTGVVAFSHHVPDNGDAFIFFGPHIGITDEGSLGKMIRPGQSRETNSCGALMLALERMCYKDIYVPEGTEFDYQQTLLERILIPYKQRIITAKNKRKEITEVAYEEIYKRVNNLIKLAKGEFTCERIFLLGGIIINTSPDYPDFVDIRDFDMLEVRNLEETDIVSILKTEAFKKL